jgi:hypothetical protein
MPGTIDLHDTIFLRRLAMVRQKTRDAFTAKTSMKAKLLAEDKTSSTSLEVSRTPIPQTIHAS